MTNTTKGLIKEGKLIADGSDYLTDDGRVIKRVYAGRRGNTLKWKVVGNDFLYRDLWCAYFDQKY